MTIRVGCIEDHDPDALLLRHALDAGHVPIDHFYRANDLRGLQQMLDSEPIDLILLDLGLPDSSGVETVVQARHIAGTLPIIVLTGSDESGVAAISSGADDFLSKDLIGGGQLARMVTYAVERHRLRMRVDAMENNRELDRIEQSTNSVRSAVTARMLGDVPLSELAPDIHNGSVSTFVEVVRDRLRRNAMGTVVADDQRMRLLGERLATRNAGPDDVVRLLSDSVDRQRQQLSPAQFGPFVREARLALIELMGFVLAHYRRHAMVGRARNEIDVSAGAPDESPPTDGEQQSLAIELAQPTEALATVPARSDSTDGQIEAGGTE